MHARNERPKWAGALSTRMVKATLRTYGTVCHICGADGANSADHVVPRSRGGADTIENLRPAHRACNLARGAQPLDGGNVLVLVGPPRSVSQWLAAHREPGDVLISDARIDDALSAGTSPAADRAAQAARQAALSAAVATGARVLLVPAERSRRRDPGVWIARGWTVLPVGADGGTVGGTNSRNW